MSVDCIVVLVTAKDAAEAEKISGHLLRQKLIACANIVKGVKSLFWWEGKIDSASEVLLVMKSRKAVFPKIVKEVKANHSYQVPEIIALPVVAGQKDYLSWVKESVK